MSEKGESITDESITEDKESYKGLISNHEKLAKLINDLTQKNEQIKHIKQKVETQLHIPIRPATFDLQAQSNQGWNDYFEEAKRYIQNKNNQETLKEQLIGLEKESKEIEAEIRPLVPLSFYGIQILSGNRRLKVNEESMTT